MKKTLWLSLLPSSVLLSVFFLSFSPLSGTAAFASSYTDIGDATGINSAAHWAKTSDGCEGIDYVVYMYFAENDLPSGYDNSNKFNPYESDGLYVIRDNVKYGIGIPDQGIIWKYPLTKMDYRTWQIEIRNGSGEPYTELTEIGGHVTWGDVVGMSGLWHGDNGDILIGKAAALAYMDPSGSKYQYDATDYRTIPSSFCSDISFNNSKLTFSIGTNDAYYGSDYEYIPAIADAVKVNGEAVGVLGATMITLDRKNSVTVHLENTGVTLARGDILTVNGVFFANDDSTVGIYLNKLSFTYDGTTFSQTMTIEENREYAIDSVTSYKPVSSFDAEDQPVIQGYIDEAVTEINAVTGDDYGNAIAAIVTEAKAKIDTVRTTLEKYQDAAVSEVNDYKSGSASLYRDEQWAEIQAIKAEFAENVYSAEDIAGTDEMKLAALTAIDAIATDAEMYAEELLSAKAEARQQVIDCYGEIDFTSLSEAEIAAINQDVKDVLAVIDGATSIEDVKAVTETFLAKYRKGEKASSGCSGSVLASSALLFTLSFTGSGLVYISSSRRKKHEKK